MTDIKKYGETETEKWANSLQKSREIVSEIMNFGVSQEQVLQIINLLSLELENPSHMREFTNLYKRIRDNKVEGSHNTSKLILDS